MSKTPAGSNRGPRNDVNCKMAAVSPTGRLRREDAAEIIFSEEIYSWLLYGGVRQVRCHD